MDYDTVSLSTCQFNLAQAKADELVAHFKPKIVNRGRSGSQIQDVHERLRRLSEDQLTGQLAQLAGTIYMTGSDQMYRIQRWACMRHPDSGDGGFDIPGLCLDWKGSRLRPGLQPKNYVLPVRPNERKEGWTYGLVVVDVKPCSTGFCADCHIMGWAADNELDGSIKKEGLFKGAYVIPYSSLHPLPRLRWQL